MSNPFVAEIRIFPFNFAPTGWAFCAGQLLPISQNTALFSLLGTTYGGDGKSNFALPNMQGNVPMFYGQGPGLSLYDIGETGGSQNVTLLQTEMPAHPHALKAEPIAGNVNTPSPQVALARSDNATAYQTVTNTNVIQMAVNTVAPNGGNQPHNNLMPYLTLNFCIALQGVFPPRT
jgi:microcystin-dependent protein